MTSHKFTVVEYRVCNHLSQSGMTGCKFTAFKYHVCNHLSQSGMIGRTPTLRRSNNVSATI